MLFPRISSFSTILKSLAFWIMFLVLLVVTVKMIQPLLPDSWEQFVYGTGGTMAAFLLCWFFISQEKKTFRDYELYWQSATIRRFIKGFIIGVAIFAGIILAMVWLSGIGISRAGNRDPGSAFWLLSIIPLALMEEVAFRSYPFLKLNKVFGLGITQIIVAVAFALYHILMGWDITIAIVGPGIWALVFGLGAIWSKGIALPTGIHVALNFSQEVVGIKESNASPLLVLSENPAAALLPPNTVGLICQLLAGVVSVILTIGYIRKYDK